MDSHEVGRLIVRADGGARMGAGHLMRCLALAQRWQTGGGKCTFLSCCGSDALRFRIESEGFDLVPLSGAHPDPSDLRMTLSVLRETFPPRVGLHAWVVLDGYHFDFAYQRAIRTAGYRLLVIDDNAHLERYCADALLNQNIFAERLNYSVDSDAAVLLGTRYALLRKEFVDREYTKFEASRAAQKILVTMGGSDPDNITLKIVRSLLQIGRSDVQFRVVAGPANPHLQSLFEIAENASGNLQILTAANDMSDLMAWADLAISAGGSTCWELAFMGVPALAVILAENQRETVMTLSGSGVIVNLDCLSADSEWISARVLSLVHDQGARARMSRLGRALVDGGGAERVVDILNRKGPEEEGLHLRAADPSDAPLFWQWANDPATRANSFCSDPIPWETHLDWFSEKLGSAETRIWVLEHRGIPVGQIRYDRMCPETAQISFTIAPRYRGRGMGTKLLDMSSALARRELQVKRVEGIAFVDNVASSRAFLKAGFNLVARKTVSGVACMVFGQPSFQAHPGDLPA